MGTTETIEVKISRRSPGYISIMSYVNGKVYETHSIPEERITSDSQLADCMEKARQEAINRPRYNEKQQYSESMDEAIHEGGGHDYNHY